MTAFLLYLLLWIWDNRSYDAITRSNRTMAQAEKAYEDKQYDKAADFYYGITYGSFFSEPAARLNLAHSFYQAGKLQEALHHYQLLDHIQDRQVASRANVQIALIAISRQDTAQALDRLVTALRQDQENPLARYNYEILKKTYSGRTLANKPKPDPTPPPRDEIKEAPAPPPQQEGQSPELAEQREQLLKQLRQLRMSEEQARSILDAMKTNEMQYIYQLRRRQYRNQSDKSEDVEW